MPKCHLATPLVLPQAAGASASAEARRAAGNTVLSLYRLSGVSDLRFCFSNESTSSALARWGHTVAASSQRGLVNEALCRAISSATCAMRGQGTMLESIVEMVHNLVPYPDANLISVALAPLPSHRPGGLYPMTREQQWQSFSEMTLSVTQPGTSETYSGLGPVGSIGGVNKYMACALQLRGSISPKDVMQAMAQLKARRDLQFVEWSSAGLKCGMSRSAPVSKPLGYLSAPFASVCSLSNCCGVLPGFLEPLVSTWDGGLRADDQSWLQGHADGMDLFDQALQGTRTLAEDYREVSLSADEDEWSDSEEY